MLKKLLLGFAAIFAVAFASAADDAVVTLTDDTYEEYIKGDKTVLIKIYAPWCGHCKRLAPEYSRAAKTLQGKAVLAKIDATTSSKAASYFQVTGYPTLKFYHNKKMVDYDGGRDEVGIVRWVEKRLGDAVTVLGSAAEVAERVKKNQSGETAVTTFVINYTDKSGLLDAIKPYADENRDSAEFIAIKSNSDSVVAKRKDEKDVTLNFSGSSDSEIAKLKDFLSLETFPLFGAINGDNFGKYMERNFDMVWVCSDEKDFERLGTVVRDIALSHRKEYSMIWLDTNKFATYATDSLNVKDFPAVVIQKKEGRYIYNSKEISAAGLKQFFEDVKNGKIEKSLKSEPVPEDNTKPVRIIVASTLEQEVLNTSKYVMLEVYAPWCGHCKRLDPIYLDLAEKLAAKKNLVIAKMDGTANESPSTQFEWTGFPTIFFISGPANDRKVIKYSGSRDYEGFSSFIMAQMKDDFGPETEAKKLDDIDTHKDEL